jgi:hypothetical protein
MSNDSKWLGIILEAFWSALDFMSLYKWEKLEQTYFPKRR